MAEESGLPLERVLDLVDDATSRPLLGLGGPKSVNVVKLNEALEAHAMTDRPERSLFERDIMRARDRRLVPQARPAA